MKRTAPCFGIKRRTVGTISNQVIAFLIFQHAADAIAQVIVILDRDTTCLAREIVHPLLCLESSVTTTGQHLVNTASSRVIGSSQAESLQTGGVHCVDDDRGAAGLVN